MSVILSIALVIYAVGASVILEAMRFTAGPVWSRALFAVAWPVVLPWAMWMDWRDARAARSHDLARRGGR